MARITLTVCDTRVGPVYRWHGLPQQLTPESTKAEIAAFKFAQELTRVLGEAAARSTPPAPKFRAADPLQAGMRRALAGMAKKGGGS